MGFGELFDIWSHHAAGELVRQQYRVDLTLENAAKIEALAELFPLRTREQLLAELLAVAMDELVARFPSIQGEKIIATDEEGDPIYEDVGYTPRFLALVHKHAEALRADSRIAPTGP